MSVALPASWATRSTMSALVPYVARARPYLHAYGRYPKRRRTMGSALHSADKWLTRAEWAARRIQRWQRKRKKNSPIKRAFKSYARPARAPQPSKHTAFDINQTENTRELNAQAIPFPTEGIEPQNRQRNTIILSGIKICLEFQNLLTDQNLYANVALVRPRDATTTNSIVPARFFRSVIGQDRGADFPLGTDFQCYCRPINVDKYDVFYHRRMIIPCKASVNKWTEVKESTRRIMKYIRFKKQIRFDDINITNSNLTLVHWYGRTGYVNGFSATNAVQVSGDLVTYFRDPKT